MTHSCEKGNSWFDPFSGIKAHYLGIRLMSEQPTLYEAKCVRLTDNNCVDAVIMSMSIIKKRL